MSETKKTTQDMPCLEPQTYTLLGGHSFTARAKCKLPIFVRALRYDIDIRHDIRLVYTRYRYFCSLCV